MAAGELGELFQEGGLGAVEHAEGEQDVLGEVALGKLRAGRLSDATELLVQAVGHLQDDVDADRHRDDIRRFDSRLRGVGVGAHQAAGAEQNAAEVAGDHHRHVFQTCMLNGLEGRHTRRLGRLAVVGVAHATAAQHVGVHVVARHAVSRLHLGDESECLFLSGDRRDLPDEVALLLDDLGLGTSGYGLVRGHYSPSFSAASNHSSSRASI